LKIFWFKRNLCSEVNIRDKPHLNFNMDETSILLIMTLQNLSSALKEGENWRLLHAAI
jgi:hypothetical protein